MVDSPTTSILMARLTTPVTPAEAAHMKTVVLVKKETQEQVALHIKVAQVRAMAAAVVAVQAVQVQIALAVQLGA
jgi:hypothetical protein